MFSPDCLCLAPFLITLEEAITPSNMSLSKGSSGSEFSVDGSLYFLSIANARSRLYAGNVY